MKLSELIAFLFPLRTHLETEIVEWKAQLAQANRRIDVLQTELIASKRPQLLVRANETTKKAAPVVPKGWDATRAAERAKPHEPIPGRPDAGSEDSVDGAGIETDQAVSA